MRTTIPILLTGLAAAFLLAGCGSKGTTTSTASTADWAGSVCTAITTWKTSVYLGRRLGEEWHHLEVLAAGCG